MTSVTVSEVNQAVVTQSPISPNIVDVILPGPQGPPGAKGEPGGTSIGGYEVAISGISVGDILAFSGTNWFNNPQDRLTDGGNF